MTQIPYFSVYLIHNLNSRYTALAADMLGLHGIDSELPATVLVPRGPGEAAGVQDGGWRALRFYVVIDERLQHEGGA